MTGPRVLVAQQKIIALNNAYVARQEIRFFSNATNDWEPWVGTDIRVRLSRYATGFDFNGMPSTLLGPYVMTATAEPGWYYNVMAADVVTPALTALVGQVVYQIVEGAYGTSKYDFTDSIPLLVVDPRSPIP